MPLPQITTTRTPANDLPYLFPGQAQKEAFVNEAFARLDALVQPVVIDERSVPPATPSSGDCYLVGEDASGIWTGHEMALAVWAETQWLFCTPHEGARLFDIASGCVAMFSAAEGWERIAAPPLPAGGSIQDAEARGTIAALIGALRAAGIFSA